MLNHSARLFEETVIIMFPDLPDSKQYDDGTDRQEDGDDNLGQYNGIGKCVHFGLGFMF